MKEIKFRCWISFTQEMVGWDEMEKHGDIYRLIKQPNAYPLMQYTGLKDKNGKEIYEGDLIELHKNKNGCCQVVFENSYVGGWVLTEPKNKGSRLSLGARDPSDIEVIGTTYENPDLIGDI